MGDWEEPHRPDMGTRYTRGTSEERWSHAVHVWRGVIMGYSVGRGRSPETSVARHRNCHRRVANSRSLQAQVIEGPDHCRKSTPAGSRRRRKESGTGVKRIAREHKHARIDTNALRESGGGARSAQESGGERPRSSRQDRCPLRLWRQANGAFVERNPHYGSGKSGEADRAGEGVLEP